MHTICVKSLEQLCLNVTVGGGISLFSFKMECDVALIDDGRLEAHMSVKHECCVKKRGRDKNGPHWSLPPVAAPSPPTLASGRRLSEGRAKWRGQFSLLFSSSAAKILR